MNLIKLLFSSLAICSVSLAASSQEINPSPPQHCPAPYGNYPACDTIVIANPTTHQSCARPAEIISVRPWDGASFRIMLMTYAAGLRTTRFLDYSWSQHYNLWTVSDFSEPSIDDLWVNASLPSICSQTTDASIIARAAPKNIEVVEYILPEKNHYFLSAHAGEIAWVDAGGAGTWKRTGKTLKLWAGSSFGQFHNACRFYNHPPVTHFYTINFSECSYLAGLNPTNDINKGWVFEDSNAFIGQEPDLSLPSVDGLPRCFGDNLPVVRFYNNRHTQNDANHRFVSLADTATINEMLAQGWIKEGVAFCQRR